jgi:3-hydroxymyristoyl/3-hydroxydecanoyl-(acyl carrier protein) dehydratase
MLPVELHAEQQGDTLTLRLHVVADLFWFRGHFPTLPILPGVAQLDWALHYGLTRLAIGKSFAAELALQLQWQAEKSLLSFSYSLINGDVATVASSGKIRLC